MYIGGLSFLLLVYVPFFAFVCLFVCPFCVQHMPLNIRIIELYHFSKKKSQFQGYRVEKMHMFKDR